MRLDREGLHDKQAWIKAGYRVPEFDREKVRERTFRNPVWIHFGAGNIFRAFQADILQNLLNAGKADFGLIAAEGYDYEIIEKINRPHDDYSILVTLKSDGSTEKTVIGSIVEALALDADNQADFSRLLEIFSNPGLQMASFTITEKGYHITDGNGVLLSDAENDFKEGPKKPGSYIGKVTALLHARYTSGKSPIAMISMDNCSHKGDRLYEAVLAFAKHWEEEQLVKQGFEAYVSNPKQVSFPWSMIDKITPRPDEGMYSDYTPLTLDEWIFCDRKRREKLCAEGSM